MCLSFLLLLALYPQRPVVIEEHVDMIEINHYFSQEATPIFDQYIFWEWRDDLSEYAVRSWLIKEYRSDSSSVDFTKFIRDYSSMLYSVEFTDTVYSLKRRIISKRFRESWSQKDPERDNQRVIPDNMRTRLINVQQPEPPTIIIEETPN